MLLYMLAIYDIIEIFLCLFKEFLLCLGLIYVVDCTDVARFVQASSELHNILDDLNIKRVRCIYKSLRVKQIRLGVTPQSFISFVCKMWPAGQIHSASKIMQSSRSRNFCKKCSLYTFNTINAAQLN